MKKYFCFTLLFAVPVFCGANVVIEQSTADSFRLRTGEYTLTYNPQERSDKQGWIMIRRDGVQDGFATKLANGQFLDVTDPAAGEGHIYHWDFPRKDHILFRELTVSETEDEIVILIKSERQWAAFESTLRAYKAHPGLVHWTVHATAKHDQAFTGKSSPECFFTIGDEICQEWTSDAALRPAARYHVQRGPVSGIAYFRDPAMNSFVFYFQDFSSLNDLYRLTQCAVPYDYPAAGNPGAVKMGTPEHYFQMSSPDGNNVKPMLPYREQFKKYKMFGFYRPENFRVPAGTTLTFTDTYLYLKPVVKADNVAICRNFVEMLGDIYQFIYKPPMVKTDWVNKVVPQLVTDVMRPENNSVVQDKYIIPKAYVRYEHNDNQLWTVLNLLHPLELYLKQHPEHKEAQELRRRLDECLPLYYDKDWKGFHNTFAPVNQDVYFTVVYIYTQAVMMADLAQLGNENAKMMMAGYRDTLLKMGKAFDYVMADIWLRDFSKQQTWYQADATACYIHVMMIMYELSGGKDRDCLKAAKAAADKMGERAMDFFWQASMTAAGLTGCEMLYKATGEERYRELAYIPLANLMKEAWLWECDFGIGEKTANFYAFSGCPAAPCTAEFENFRARFHMKDYAATAGNYLNRNVLAMVNDGWVRGSMQSRYTLPPILIEEGLRDILPVEGKSQTNCGEIRYDEMIPLEDWRVGWGTDIEWWQNNPKPGVVGQELYGAGGPILYAVWQDEINAAMDAEQKAGK